MQDKTGQILQAALHVFAKKGYNESTTQEIAGEAQVAEITIFRKFKTKQNLFVSTIQAILKNKFEDILLHSAQQEDTEQFIIELLSNRLKAVSKNQMIIKTLLSESLMGNLEKKIDLPLIMFQTIKRAMEQHFAQKSVHVEIDQLVRVFSGLLISYLVWAPPVPFHKLSKAEQAALTQQYAQILKPYWENGAKKI